MIRRTLFALLLLVASIGAAQAVTRDQAWAQCLARAAQRDGTNPNDAPHGCAQAFIAPDGQSGSYWVTIKTGVGLGSLNYPWSGQGCGSGRWNEAKKVCAPSESECKAKSDLGRGITTGGSTATCSGECEFKPLGNLVSIGFPDGTVMTPSTAWKASGAMCGSSTPAPPPSKDQECRPAGSNQTMCVKPDGQQCASASTGRQVCWRPGETGEKTDGPVLQKRNAGPTEIPPSNLQLPSGDSLVKQGQSVTTTSSTTVNTTTTTSTTTTTNYATQSGTNAGPKGDGESGTGDGSGKEGDGDDDGSASGGQNCETPLQMTGDPLLMAIAQQQFLTRCPGGTAPDPSEYIGEGPADGKDTVRSIGEDFVPDEQGFGYSRSCPAIPTVTVMGKTITFDTGVFCDWMQLGGWFVVLIAGIVCARILGGA